MFAVIRTGGKQYKVSPGDVLEVERLDQEVSAKFVLDDVLLVGGDDELIVGSPKIEGAGVECTVVKHIRGEKIRVFKFKAKKRYRRTQGHRQELTILRIDSVAVNGSREAAPSKAKASSKARSAPKSSAKAKAVASSGSRAKASVKAAAKVKPATRARTKSKSASKSSTGRKTGSGRKTKSG